MRSAATVRLAVAGALAATLAAAAVLAGCDSSTPPPTDADRLATVLGHPAWTSGVDVGSGRNAQGTEYVATVVSLRAAATADQVADFVAALPAATTRAGLASGFNYRQLTFVSADGARLNVGWTGAVDRAAVRASAQEWLAVGREFHGGTSATVLTSGPASYVVDLGAGGPAAVAAGYEDLAPIAQLDSAWEVKAQVGGEQLDLKSAVLPTTAQLALWTALLDRLAALPAPVEAGGLDVDFQSDRTVADLALTVAAPVSPQQLTVAAWGDRLWPVFRPQLAGLAALTEPWSYAVTVAPRSSPASTSGLISLLSDQGTSDNGDEAARWSKAAQVYVQSLSS